MHLLPVILAVSAAWPLVFGLPTLWGPLNSAPIPRGQTASIEKAKSSSLQPAGSLASEGNDLARTSHIELPEQTPKTRIYSDFMKAVFSRITDPTVKPVPVAEKVAVADVLELAQVDFDWEYETNHALDLFPEHAPQRTKLDWVVDHLHYLPDRSIAQIYYLAEKLAGILDPADAEKIKAEESQDEDTLKLELSPTERIWQLRWKQGIKSMKIFMASIPKEYLYKAQRDFFKSAELVFQSSYSRDPWPGAVFKQNGNWDERLNWVLDHVYYLSGGDYEELDDAFARFRADIHNPRH